MKQPSNCQNNCRTFGDVKLWLDVAPPVIELQCEMISIDDARELIVDLQGAIDWYHPPDTSPHVV